MLQESRGVSSPSHSSSPARPLKGAQAPQRLLGSDDETIWDDQATKGGGWMPWGQEPKKGAAHSEMPRGAASML